MADTLHLWSQLQKTDPKYTKSFKRAGGFSGNDINPVWRWKRMTEVFGPAGVGWGTQDETVTYQPAGDGQVLVYVTLKVWYRQDDGEPAVTPLGVGGDFVAKQTKYGLGADDEAVKKATTDAIGNAMKFIGVGADIFLGQFEDSKYQQEVAVEYQAKEKQEAEQAAADNARKQLEEAAPPAKDGDDEDPAVRVTRKIEDQLARVESEEARQRVRNEQIKKHWRALPQECRDRLTAALKQAADRLAQAQQDAA